MDRETAALSGDPRSLASEGVPSTILAMLAARAASTPDFPALAAPDRGPSTYAELAGLVHEIAGALQGLGIGPGDRVAIVLPNGPEMAACFLAVAALAASAPLNPTYRSAEFEFYLRDLAPRALILQAGMDTPARALAERDGIAVLELSPRADRGAGRFVLNQNSFPLDPARLPGPTEIALILHTSGTTARPKMVGLSQANLCASARNIAAWLALSPADRCLNVMPLFHIHGLVGAALSTWASGGTLIASLGFQATRFFDWLDALTPTWYTAVPTMHQAVLARAAQLGRPHRSGSLRFVRSSSAALPPQIMQALEALFGAPVLEAYGMTEASHQMACNPLPPRPRKPGSVGQPAGTRIAVMDEAGTLLEQGRTGEIVIQGPGVTAGYIGDPDASARAFTNGWFRTGDQGSFDAEGYLFISGRTKEIINRGGEKVSPREVEEVLLDHPAVAEALAFAMPDSRVGEEVAAAVVLGEGMAAEERGLREFAAGRLADFKLPRRIVFLDAMPKGATGKPQRIGMAERLGLRGAHAAEADGADEHGEPGSDTEKLLAHVWARTLRLPQVGLGQDFFELGGDSLSAIEMITEVERQAGVKLSVADLFQAPNVRALSRLIDAGPGERRIQRLFAIQPHGNGPAFFCIGAGPLMRELALGLDHPFLSPLCYDFTALPHPCRIEDIAAYHVETIRTTQPVGPYFLGGWCIDGVVAWETARQLRAAKQEVGLVVLFDAANEAASSDPWRRLAAGMMRRVREFGEAGVSRFPALLIDRAKGVALRARRTAERVQYERTLKRRAEVDVVLADQLTIQHRALRHYQPGPLDAPVLLLYRSTQPALHYLPDGLGWRSLAADWLEARAVGKHHRAMFLSPDVSATASFVRDALAYAQKKRREQPPAT
ncbi:MAG: AMP-binding protein [Acetobacteraceae bacterium]|nr:AMP-binding protein [Acetobacteraceae bacterium]